MTTYAIVAADPTPSAAPGTGGDAQQGQGSPWSLFLLMGLMFAVLYLFIIHPQNKKRKTEEKQRQEMLTSLKKNDRVMTLGRIYGIVASVGEEDVMIKVDEKNDVRLRVAREGIMKVLQREGEGEKPGETTEHNR